MSNPSPSDPTGLPTEELVARVLAFHADHLEQLPELIELAFRVEARHSGHDACPLGLGEHLLLMFEELEEHQRKEEGVLFPRLLEGTPDRLLAPLARMESDHSEVLAQLDEIRRVTREFKAPVDACGFWRRLYEGCRAFDRDLREHVRLEQEVLFPRAFPEGATGCDLDLAQRAVGSEA